ncbi:MAG: transporter substrate-binding domain-containing protein [Pseudomonadota bacterium]|nr:transporter substrate-binding domain-containing protein [Pseudomonadota bacterium]
MIKITVNTVLWLLLLLPAAARSDTLQLHTTAADPYQVIVNGELSGVSVSILRCVLAGMDQPYEMKLMPWVRAVEDLKHQTADGIFTAMPASELDAAAEMSYPFTLERWFWVTRPGDHPAQGRGQPGWRIGAVRSSNQLSWLEQQGTGVAVEVNSLSQLIHMLRNKRLDAFLADDRVLTEELHKLGFATDSVALTFSRYMPLGIYFSRTFLSRYPAFIAAFNAGLKDCMPDPLQLSDSERQRIMTTLRDELMPRLQTAATLLADVEQTLPAATVQRREDVWPADLSADVPLFVGRILYNPLAEQLRRWQKESAGLISEIYITGPDGVNVAMGQLTSDYIQADEKPYQQLSAGHTDLYIGPVVYDASSHRFQVKAGWQLQPQDGRSGFIFIGLDAEKALQNSYERQH